MIEPVTLDMLQEQGFVFRNFGKLPDGMLESFNQLNFQKSRMKRGVQSSYECRIESDSDIHHYFINKVAEHVNDDPFLSETIYHMRVGIDKCIQGDFVMPHTDIECAGVWQVALFYPYPNNDEFEGREFLYGTRDEFQVARPKEGMAVFIDTTKEKYIHAVRELLSDHVFFAVGINPHPPGGRDETLIKYEDLIEPWGVEVNACEMETAVR